MSRVFRLLAGALLMAVGGVIDVMTYLAARPNHGAMALAAAFFVPGGILFAMGLRSGLPEEAEDRLEMRWAPRRFLLGLGASAAALSVLWLDHAVVHLLPHPLLAGALVAVPLGLVSAASSWTEVCTRCERPLEVCHGRLSPEERAALSVQLAQPELLSTAYAQRVETGELGGSQDVRIAFCGTCREALVASYAGKKAFMVGRAAARVLAGK